MHGLRARRTGWAAAGVATLVAAAAHAQPAVGPPEALVIPAPGAPTLDGDAALAEAAANFQPYRQFRVDAGESAWPRFAFDAPVPLRLPPPAPPQFLTSAVEARAADVVDPTQPRSVGGAVTLAPPPSQIVQVKADLDVQAGDRPDPGVAWPAAAAPSPASPWRRLGAQVAAGVNLNAQTAVDLAVDRSVEVQDLPDRPDGAAAQNSRQTQQATLALKLTPSSAVQLSASARVAEVDDLVADPQDAASTMNLRTGETTAGVTAAWTVAPALRLEASDRLGYTDAAWRETGAAAQAYAVSEPRLGAVMTPWAGAQWRLSFGRAVSALDLGAFVAVAEGLQRAADFAAGVQLAPNQEWRAQAEVKQALPGSGSLGLTLTQASLETTQELARSLDGADVPISISGGQRRELAMALTTPLALRGFSLETAAAVRDSQILDPVTGAPRRLSGEAPYDARLTLAQEVAPLGLKWGVQAHVEAAQTYYTPDQTSTAAPAQSLGMFVEYHPQPFALRLQVDGLAGGARDITDATYDGSRDSDRIVRIDHRLDGGPSFSLVLRKSL